MIKQIAKDVADAYALGVQIGIVIGGGNIFRGVAASAEGMDRASFRLYGNAGHLYKFLGSSRCS